MKKKVYQFLRLCKAALLLQQTPSHLPTRELIDYTTSMTTH